jgi:putative ABC transport system ATP-binding protein
MSASLSCSSELDAPTSGQAMWRDHDLVNAGEAALTRYRREHVGFDFQFYNLIPSLTVLENVALVNEIADRPLDPREALAMVGLTDRLDHFPSQLSGGEQQRVAVARAIVKSPDVLLCDEPTGALGYGTGKLVLAAIARINERLGTTIVVITHNAAIAGMADRVLRLVSLLDKKLWRDIAAMRAQVVTIALVAAAGIAVFVSSVSIYDSLRSSRDRFYACARFPQIFVGLKRAPLSIVSRIAAIPDVAAVQPRIVRDVIVDWPSAPLPVSARVVSLSNGADPVVLRRRSRGCGRGTW